VKDPHNIIIRPHITEKSVSQSYGDPRIREEADLVRKYTFIVATDANKLEIKGAIEAIYNEGKRKKEEFIDVQSVRTIRVPGKKRRRTMKSIGYQPDQKKAVITLAKGQMLEDYGV
jgi:large subunit ribosomal protein L23